VRPGSPFRFSRWPGASAPVRAWAPPLSGCRALRSAAAAFRAAWLSAVGLLSFVVVFRPSPSSRLGRISNLCWTSPVSLAPFRPARTRPRPLLGARTRLRRASALAPDWPQTKARKSAGDSLGESPLSHAPDNPAPSTVDPKGRMRIAFYRNGAAPIKGDTLHRVRFKGTPARLRGTLPRAAGRRLARPGCAGPVVCLGFGPPSCFVPSGSPGGLGGVGAALRRLRSLVPALRLGLCAVPVVRPVALFLAPAVVAVLGFAGPAWLFWFHRSCPFVSGLPFCHLIRFRRACAIQKDESVQARLVSRPVGARGGYSARAVSRASVPLRR